MAKATYKDAGVDLDVYRQSMAKLPRLMQKTFSPRVIRQDGGFAGLFQLDFASHLFARNYRDPVLVSCTDGVGTKLKVAQRLDKHDTVGVDLVAMSINDAICCGAEPLFFLDYIAMSSDDPNLLEQLVSGISQGCISANCALLGGETAIMPDLYAAGDYDLAGFCVGVVERRHLIDGHSIHSGDVVIGIASSGLHSNGYSLARKVAFDIAKLQPDTVVPELESTIGDALLTPTIIYANAVRNVLGHYRVKNIVHGIAHITGGGLHENLERILPPHVDIHIQPNSWTVPPIFSWLQQQGEIESDEMNRVFNMGLGLVLVVSSFYANQVSHLLNQSGHPHWQIGMAVEGSGRVKWADVSTTPPAQDS